MGFSREAYWSGLPLPSPGDLFNPEIKPKPPALQADSLPTGLWGKHKSTFYLTPYLSLNFFWKETQSTSVQFSSVTPFCPTLCDPMGCSMPSLPVHHQLPEITQTHVHWVSDSIQPSHPLSSPSPPTFNLSQHQGLFKWVSSSHQVAKSTEVSASASVLLMNIQDLFSLGWTGWISLQSKRLSTVFSNTQYRGINTLVFSFPYGPTLTSIHDHWKNHSFA